jgi:hypothetical protein
MSGGRACTCTPQDRSKWRVMHYKCNHSAFNGYHTTPSQWSALCCTACGSHWRTKAAYVAMIPEGAYSAEVIEAESSPPSA